MSVHEIDSCQIRQKSIFSCNSSKGEMEYCAEQGLRLPTIREFAEWASRECTDDIKGKEPCGAAGISETEK